MPLQYAIFPFFILLERCPSGLRSTPGKRVYRNVPGVRISASPPFMPEGLCAKKTRGPFCFIAFEKQDLLSLINPVII